MSEWEDRAFGKPFFDDLVDKHGTHSKAQGFGCPVSQESQFLSLRDHLNRLYLTTRHFTLLDVAGGTGDLLMNLFQCAWLNPKSYSCIDNQRSFLEEARRRADAALIPIGFMGEKLFDPEVPEHDVVACLGLYAMWEGRTEHMLNHASRLVKWLAGLTKVSLSVNFISPLADWYEPYNVPVPFEASIRMFKEAGFERISLDHTTAPHMYMVHGIKGESVFRKKWGKELWD